MFITWYPERYSVVDTTRSRARVCAHIELLYIVNGQPIFPVAFVVSNGPTYENHTRISLTIVNNHYLFFSIDHGRNTTVSSDDLGRGSVYVRRKRGRIVAIEKRFWADLRLTGGVVVFFFYHVRRAHVVICCFGREKTIACPENASGREICTFYKVLRGKINGIFRVTKKKNRKPH